MTRNTTKQSQKSISDQHGAINQTNNLNLIKLATTVQNNGKRNPAYWLSGGRAAKHILINLRWNRKKRYDRKRSRCLFSCASRSQDCKETCLINIRFLHKWRGGAHDSIDSNTHRSNNPADTRSVLMVASYVRWDDCRCHNQHPWGLPVTWPG